MLPEEFLEQMNLILGDEFEAFLDSYNAPSVKSLRVNTLKGEVDHFLSINPFGITKEDRVEWCPQGFYYDARNPGKHPLHSSGAYYIQEASAMAPSMELDIRKGDRILDLCASPGGKSTQIASFLDQTGLLVSNEPNMKRARILSENIERMGISNALVISHDPSELSKRFEGYFDKILVDAPGSGEGMFRKNEEAIGEWSTENVLICQDRQKSILKDAVKMLKAGGRLVYSTCTFAVEEDEEIVEYLLDSFEELRLIKSHKMWPHRIKGEGHFLAVFDKTDNGVRPKEKLTKSDAKKPKEFADFEKQVLSGEVLKLFEDERGFFIYNDELYLLSADFPSLKGLRVLRSGLHLGTLKKGRFEPSHSFALFLKPGMVKNGYSLSEEDAFRYLRGETLNDGKAYGNDGLSKSGWCLVDFMGYSLGWGKTSNGIIKNHYPKGLRIL